MNCPNLKEVFGERYRIRVEESHKAERGTEIKRAVDPWLYEIPCKYGSICPWTEDRIAASVDGHTGIAARIRRLSCTCVEQDGDFGELTASFKLEDFDKVAEIMQPRRKVQLSEEERRRRTALLAKTPSHQARPTNSQ